MHVWISSLTPLYKTIILPLSIIAVMRFVNSVKFFFFLKIPPLRSRLHCKFHFDILIFILNLLARLVKVVLLDIARTSLRSGFPAKPI